MVNCNMEQTLLMETRRRWLYNLPTRSKDPPKSRFLKKMKMTFQLIILFGIFYPLVAFASILKTYLLHIYDSLYKNFYRHI